MNGDIIQCRAAARPDAMIDARVEDLHPLFAPLEIEGREVLDRIGESRHDEAGWIIGPEGNQVEL